MWITGMPIFGQLKTPPQKGTCTSICPCKAWQRNTSTSCWRAMEKINYNDLAYSYWCMYVLEQILEPSSPMHNSKFEKRHLHRASERGAVWCRQHDRRNHIASVSFSELQCGLGKTCGLITQSCMPYVITVVCIIASCCGYWSARCSMNSFNHESLKIVIIN